MFRKVNERAADGAVPDESLIFHDAEQGLDGVEVRVASGVETLEHLADTPLAQLPKDLENLQLTLARDRFGQELSPNWRNYT